MVSVFCLVSPIAPAWYMCRHISEGSLEVKLRFTTSHSCTSVYTEPFTLSSPIIQEDSEKKEATEPFQAVVLSYHQTGQQCVCMKGCERRRRGAAVNEFLSSSFSMTIHVEEGQKQDYRIYFLFQRATLLTLKGH